MDIKKYQEEKYQSLIAKGFTDTDERRIAEASVPPKVHSMVNPASVVQSVAASKVAKLSVAAVSAKREQKMPITSESPQPVKASTKKDIQQVKPSRAKASRPIIKVEQLTSEDHKDLTLFDVAPWDDDQRAMPNDILRSSLFNARNHTVPRGMYQQEPSPQGAYAPAQTRQIEANLAASGT
ncbi:TrfA protein [Pseudomonas duriflava]|uniref:TrfA protein n=1 Tax=Pseudomonas duriflava TaxID=459528 RepID=A0A562PHM3_9PSED|nr:TrfA protein [Pseudomonas duriflava]